MAWALGVATLVTGPSLGVLQAQDEKYFTKAEGDEARPIRISRKNTFVFDHQILSTPERPEFFVLEVGHGDEFQVVFLNTAPGRFNYSIAADRSAEPEGVTSRTGDRVLVPLTEITDTSITMRHHRAFTRYRVEVKLKTASDAAVVTPSVTTSTIPPEVLADFPGTTPRPESQDVTAITLYEVEFDLWVRTSPSWTVRMNGGMAFHGLKQPIFSIKTSTDAEGKETKTVESDGFEGRPQIDALAIVNIFHERWRFGPAFGFGGQGDDLRAYLGGTVNLFNFAWFTTGAVFGKVNVLPTGQALHEKPINDNVLANLRQDPDWSWYFGFTLDFLPKTKDDFVTAFSSGTKTKDATAVSPAVTALAGTYWSGDKEYTVAASGAGVTLKGDEVNLAFPKRTDLTFTTEDGSQSLVFELAADKKTPVKITLKTGAEDLLSAARQIGIGKFAGAYKGAKTYFVNVDGKSLVVTVDGTAVTFERTGNATFKEVGGSRALVFELTDNGQDVRALFFENQRVPKS